MSNTGADAEWCAGRPGAKIACLAFGAGFGAGAAYQESSKEVSHVVLIAREECVF